METPSSSLSTRRVTRSQTASAINNSASDFKIPFSSKKTEDSSIGQRKSVKAQEDRSALIDITNDSPIVGLAMQTPPSGFTSKRKNNSRIKSTPGSGEALLRGQVKNLLQKVEEGAELIHSMKSLPFIHLVTSPMRLLAPTPANTPQFPNFSVDDEEVQIKIASPVVAGHLRPSQVSYVTGTWKGSEIFEEEEEEEEECMSVSRSLFPDFTEKSALWEEEEGEGDVDELCEGMKKMSVVKTQAEFAGKHSRFVYNGEDEEIVEAQEVLRLRGIPTPRGKHVRFAADEEQEEESSSTL
ncbi:unnamed protein product [Microthlaspi erraticum]|uniref:Uncharacterized protein n=1 Tax=Microthlaspi erraticum TaxID=1685480 RepID=A0A6D2HXG9_9BRAS|nr:unnamed protein product [Microthlaspi erraticum]